MFVMLTVVGRAELSPLTFIWLLNQIVFPAPIEVPLKFELITLTASARVTEVRASNIVTDAESNSSFLIISFSAIGLALLQFK